MKAKFKLIKNKEIKAVFKINAVVSEQSVSQIYDSINTLSESKADISEVQATASILNEKCDCLQTELDAKQDKLSSDNAGKGINIHTDETGKITISSSSSVPQWGDIEGNITNQSDLKEALDLKLNKYDLSNYNLTKIDEYLYSINYDKNKLDYQKALQYFKENYKENDISLASCSAIRKGNFFGRNYDWYYSESVSFVVKKEASSERYASIGMSGGLSSLTKDIVNSYEWNIMYDILPFFLLDGINEYGVTVSMNVVTGDKGKTTGTHPELQGDEICALMLPSYILDNFKSAQESVNWLLNSAKIYAPYNETIQEELHFMIADKDNTFIVEFVNNEAKVTETNKNYLTNFYLDGATYLSDGKINIDSLPLYSQGIERYNLISENYESLNSSSDMLDMMRELNYTNAYNTEDISNWWKTEFVAPYADKGFPYPNLTIHSTTQDFIDCGLLDVIQERFATRTRDGINTWQTIHSAVYDINKKQFILLTQEKDKETLKTFQLFSNIGDGKLVITQDNTVLGEFNANQQLDTVIDIPRSASSFEDLIGSPYDNPELANALSDITQGSLEWGNVSGDIQNQTDLKNILNEKISYLALSEITIILPEELFDKYDWVDDESDSIEDEEHVLDGGVLRIGNIKNTRYVYLD